MLKPYTYTYTVRDCYEINVVFTCKGLLYKNS